MLSKNLVKDIEGRLAREPQRYSRRIDAVLLDDAISIICNPNLYCHFRAALEQAFPEGCSEARTFLCRLLDPRNKLAHANPISSHDAERVFCYSSDVVSSISEYYREQKMNQEYNVPLFIRYGDSFGNSIHRDQMLPTPNGGVMVQYHTQEKYDLRPGDILAMELEVDATFNSDEYTLTWKTGSVLRKTEISEPSVSLEITAAHVAEQFTIIFSLKTHNDWHRIAGGRDDIFMVTYRVLPPI